MVQGCIISSCTDHYCWGWSLLLSNSNTQKGTHEVNEVETVVYMYRSINILHCSAECTCITSVFKYKVTQIMDGCIVPPLFLWLYCCTVCTRPLFVAFLWGWDGWRCALGCMGEPLLVSMTYMYMYIPHVQYMCTCCSQSFLSSSKPHLWPPKLTMSVQPKSIVVSSCIWRCAYIYMYMYIVSQLLYMYVLHMYMYIYKEVIII